MSDTVGGTWSASAAAARQDAQMIEDMFEGYDDQELKEIQEAQKDIYGSKPPVIRSCFLPAMSGTCSSSRRISPLPQQMNQQQQDDDASTASFSSSMTERAVQGLKDAMGHLSPSQREAYEEAMGRNPSVVELETPLNRWVLAHDLNLWKSAERLAQYWTKRREIYGHDRYHRPLTLVGGDEGHSSAMCPDAIQALLSGAYSLLPPDGFGRPIILLDREKMLYHFRREDIRLQIFFYLYQVMFENDKAIENGVVLLYCMESASKSSSFGVQKGAGGAKLHQSQVVPVKIRALHFLITKENSVLERATKTILPRMLAWKQLGFRVVRHCGTSRQYFINNLKQYAISEVHVPERFGGTHIPEESCWYRERLRLEARRYAFLSVEQPLAQANDSGLQSHGSQNQRKDECSRKRKIEEIRCLAEEFAEKKKIAKLEAKQMILKKENEALEAYVTCAKFISKQFERDYQTIHSYLKPMMETLAPLLMSNTPITETGDETANAHLFLKECFVFQGREAVSGEWIFTASERLLLKQGAVPVLMKLEQDLRRLQSIQDQQQTYDGKDTKEPPQGEDGHTERLKLETHEDGMEEDHSDLDSLQSHVAKLQAQKSALQERQDFLRSLKTCAEFLAAENDRDRKCIRKDIFKALDALNVTKTLSGSMMDEFLDRVLKEFTLYQGRNPATGEKMYQFKEGLLQELQQLPGGKSEVAAAVLSFQQHMRRKTAIEMDQKWREARAKRKVQLKRL